MKPDLVFIGGISQKDTASIREVIHQLRAALPEVEILWPPAPSARPILATRWHWPGHSHSGTGTYGKALKKLAKEEHSAFSI